MRVSKITEVVESIALPIVERENMELVDVEFVKEGPDWFLRVYIDKPGASIWTIASISMNSSRKN